MWRPPPQRESEFDESHWTHWRASEQAQHILERWMDDDIL